VYVTENGVQSLSKFSPTGAPEWTINGNTTTDPALAGHFDQLAVDSHNRVLAAVEDAHTIAYIDPAGHKVDSFSTRGDFLNDWGPCSLSVSPAGDTVVESCPGPPTGSGPPPGGPYLATLLFDRTHRLVGAWYHDPISVEAPPQFGPHGEVFALASTLQANGLHRGTGGAILRLKVAMPSE
jgi:hypothetical protein